MILNYYGLREQPFGVTPDPRYLYAGVSHRKALASLVHSYESGLGFASLIAEPGLGKTTLLHSLLTRIGPTTRNAYIFETQCDSREMLRHLLCDLDAPPSELDMNAMFRTFRDLAVNTANSGRRLLIMIDEAQNLNVGVLETVRLLSNFETSTTKLVHIVLAGQPQLAEVLNRPELAQMRQRVITTAYLEPLSIAGVAEYINHRLQTAGYRGAALFTPEALALIAQQSRGIPREINRICFNAMLLCCTLEQESIDAARVNEAEAGLDFGPMLEKGASDLQPPKFSAVSRSTAMPDGEHLAEATMTARSNDGQFVTSSYTAAGNVRSKASEPIGQLATDGSAALDYRLASEITTPTRGPVVVAKSAIPVTLKDGAKSAKRGGNRKATLLLTATIVLGMVVLVLGVRSRSFLRPPSPVSPEVHAEPAPAVQPASRPAMPKDEGSVLPVVRSKHRNQSKSAMHAPPREELSVQEPAPSLESQPLDGKEGSDAVIDRPSPAAPKRPDENSLIEADPMTIRANMGFPKLATAEPVAPALRPRDAPRVEAMVPAGITLITRVEPQYPTEAKRAQMAGSVILLAHVSKDGKVTAVRPLTGNSVLATAAVDAVRQWVYTPFTINDQAVEVDTTVVVKFVL
jgi:general secretion pathway protein A